MTEKKEYPGYPKYEMDMGFVVLTVGVTGTNLVEVHSHALFRRLDTPKQVKGTLGSYSFNSHGEYEGIADWSANPPPKCPQELIDGMAKLKRIYDESIS